MSEFYIPFLEIFLGFLGFCLSIMFCIIFSTALSRVCNHLRQGQRETLRRSEQDERPPPIYFIPFSRGMSQQDSEDPLRVPGQSQELHSPPRYSTAVHCGPPPAYNELEFKPDDLPPAYTEYSTPVYPITLPPHTAMVQPQTQSQQ